ncbi:single-stranded DNA-binding protein [Paracoccus salsus]|uniref:single-stranded DNA-binding protein n=1 Tax=Paracoccus salsus TaxID=2911061 RepID=UPI001F36A385|nr:single-stranded DNA-binding protein [Paracoccus salsus]MCF3975094.1 single-stranded DNA-binding protein [Paracoccus salsus]
MWRNDAGDKQERTDFFRIKCFGSQAEAHGKYLGKGSLVFVHLARGGRTTPGRDHRRSPKSIVAVTSKRFTCNND